MSIPDWYKSTAEEDPAGSIAVKFPEKCDGLTESPPGITDAQRREWMLLVTTCPESATMIVVFRCDRGHGGRRYSCGAHAQPDRQFCGYCADRGDKVPVIITVERRLR